MNHLTVKVINTTTKLSQFVNISLPKKEKTSINECRIKIREQTNVNPDFKMVFNGCVIPHPSNKTLESHEIDTITVIYIISK